MPHIIATRNGKPAYLGAPPRLTQSMVDLDRRTNSRLAELRELASQARQVGEPSLAVGAVRACFLVGSFMAIAGGVLVAVQS